METVKIIECPRDAWQGLPQQIPTEVKAAHLKTLVEAGFRHIDAVSFVSPQHVRQMADSEAVLEALLASLPTGAATPEIIGIVVNEKGIERALAARGVSTLGYPYSISAYFRRANANMSRSESRSLVEQLKKATKAAGRDMVVYISMAFGNPYEEPWGPEIVEDALGENLATAMENRRIVQAGYLAGKETLSRLNEAQRDYITVDADLSLARIRLRQAWSDLHAAAGGVETKETRDAIPASF